MAELLIVGAGAAGLFAAGAALEAGHAVTLVEQMEKPGKKLAITGKGRCNLTNACDETEFLRNIRRNPRFLYSAIHALPPHAVMEWFEHKLGLPLAEERGRRVVPQSGRAQDVVDALARHAGRATMVRGEAKRLLLDEDGNTIRGLALADGRELAADAVLLATGGVSYPATGATGTGYGIARAVGHTIQPPRPSLVAMVEAGDTAKRAMGLSLRNVALALEEDGRRVFCEQGELLFTHFGLSGPLALSASAFLGEIDAHRYVSVIDLKPALPPEKLDARIQRDFTEFANRTAANCLDKLLPASLRPVVLDRWGVEPGRRVNQITKEERLRLAALLKRLEIPIADRGDLRHAVITAGGVDVREVDPKTMHSKKAPGLYFAGEILDVDGYTGGYNLQIAWCTAYAAVRGLPG